MNLHVFPLGILAGSCIPLPLPLISFLPCLLAFFAIDSVVRAQYVCESGYYHVDTGPAEELDGTPLKGYHRYECRKACDEVPVPHKCENVEPRAAIVRGVNRIYVVSQTRVVHTNLAALPFSPALREHRTQSGHRN